ncbi:YfhO family protein [Flavisolibacter sp. BT320]|nr:YfhO family protein [Flavisolibacter longurius]
MNQSDVTHWKGAIHQSQIYKEQHGEYPLWTNALFSGMPVFQIGMPGNNLLPWYAHAVFTLDLPKPVQFFFLACICFYFLCCVLRINPYIGIFGSLAYAYATYNAVILSVGHETKMWSIAYIAALLGCVLLIYERRKYWLGAALTGLITAVLIAINHPQIDYYFFLTAAIMTIAYIIRWVRAKEFAHMVKALTFTMVPGLIGLFINSVAFLSTLEYQKQTIRGGSGELKEKAAGDAANGLTKDYAFDYSLGIAEPVVMMVPKAYGGSSDKEEVGSEESKAVEALRSLPQELQRQLPLSYYWGGIGYTSGPPYVGALICFLAIIGFFIVDNRFRWWILAAIALAILMSWGKYFPGFNTFLYNYLPLYNKFRAPSMILVIPQLLLPLMAVLAISKVLAEKEAHSFVLYFKKGLICVGAAIVLLLLCYISFDYKSEQDQALLQQVASANQPQLTEAVRSFYDGLVADRQSLMLSGILRTIGFCLLGAFVLFLAVRKTIKPVIAGVLLSAIVLLDLMPVNTTYLNHESYQEPTENEAGFIANSIDQEILNDKEYFRVFNLYNPFNENFTAYHFNAVGGYHPAKLRIYQELIENQLSKEQAQIGSILQTNPAGLATASLPALNMLNTKYLIGKNPQTGQTEFKQQNPNNLGPAWLVKSLRIVKDAKEEMAAFATLNPKDIAVMQQSFSRQVQGSSWSGEGNISLLKNYHDSITYQFNSNSPQFAVFSEVYYDAGWKAYIGDKEAPIVKVNYVLRGLQIPAGTHQISFRFEPQGYYTGRTLTAVFQYLLLAIIAFAIFMEWRTSRKPQAT